LVDTDKIAQPEEVAALLRELAAAQGSVQANNAAGGR
jgi:hypothetical protein